MRRDGFRLRQQGLDRLDFHLRLIGRLARLGRGPVIDEDLVGVVAQALKGPVDPDHPHQGDVVHIDQPAVIGVDLLHFPGAVGGAPQPHQGQQDQGHDDLHGDLRIGQDLVQGHLQAPKHGQDSRILNPGFRRSAGLAVPEERTLQSPEATQG